MVEQFSRNGESKSKKKRRMKDNVTMKRITTRMSRKFQNKIHHHNTINNFNSNKKRRENPIPCIHETGKKGQS